MKNIILSAFLSFLLLGGMSNGNLYSQTNQNSLNFPRLMVKDENSNGSELPLKLDNLDISINVLGNIATTTMEMTFFNSTNRILEGELVFPLGEGQTISRFALDINGKLREGVVVEKQKGQQVFEAVVRRNIDPGLIEKTKGNNFKTRVYPIPANGYKKVLIAFEGELNYSENEYLYLLPMNFDNRVNNFNLHVEIYNQEISPIVAKSKFENIEFKQWRNSFISDFSQQNYLPDKQLGFSIPIEKVAKKVYVDKGKVDSNNFFFINIFPKKEERGKVYPSKIALFWDVSLSGEKRDIKEEINLLKDYINKIQNVDIKLITFANSVETKKLFKIKEGNCEDLVSELSKQVYDGGTQLGSLDFNEYSCDEILFFSDGVSNFGRSDIVLSKTPVITISSSQTAEHSYLQYIASSTAGIYLNLNSIKREQALEYLTKQKLQFISAEFNKNEISEVFPSIPSNFIEKFSIAGKLLSNTASIKLNFGFGKEIVHSETISLTSNNAYNKGLIERIWAQKMINELNFNPIKNSDSITQVGKKYSIVTSNTSLIVLDRVEDYIEYEIIPPLELLDDYNNLIEKKHKEEFSNKKKHIDDVYSQFLKKVEWWNTEFKTPTIQTQKKNLPIQNIVIPPRIYSHETKTITGTVFSIDDGMPIPGVSIIVRGTSVGTSTNMDGHFQLTVPVNAILQISFVGMKSAEIDITNLTNIDVTLESESIQVEELVTTAFGIRREPRYVAPSVVDSVRSNEEVREEVSDEAVVEVNEAFMMANDEASNGSKSDALKSLNQPKIEVNKWDPNTPYMTELKRTDKKNLYEKYLLLRKDNQNTPSFYLDVAEYLLEKGMKKEAVEIISNITELKLENSELLRIVARKLLQIGEVKTAIYIFQDVVKLRPEEPQSYRDLGLAYAANNEYQKATDMLYSVIDKNWNSRFPGIEVIVIGELNAIIEQAEGKVNTDKYDSRLLKNLPVDIRVVLNWTADNTDVDLWLTDPYNDKCFYQNKLTRCGGYMSNDFTGGYGPEEFLIKKAPDGKYRVQINYYGSSQQTISGPVNVQIQMFTKFGTKQQELKEVTMRLSEKKEIIDIGELLFDKN